MPFTVPIPPEVERLIRSVVLPVLVATAATILRPLAVLPADAVEF